MEVLAAPILNLPQEVQLHVFRILPPRALVAAMRTCRSWSELAKDTSLWRVLVENRWQYIDRDALNAAPSHRQYFAQRETFERHSCNRILYCSESAISVVSPDGIEKQELHRTEGYVFQPTWDPFGRSIIWSERDSPAVMICGCAADGTRLWRFPSSYFPFYYYWTPDGNSCTYLGALPGRQGLMESRTLNVRPTVSPGPSITTGRPVFWSFCPNKAGALVGRISENLMIRRDNRSPLQQMEWPATGMSPQWSSSGRYILVSTVGPADGTNAVVLLHADNLTLFKNLTSMTGRTRCMMSQDEQWVFYTNAGKLNVIQRARGIFQGSLIAHQIATDETKVLTEGPVIAYFISPNSSKVVWIEETSNGSHLFMCWEHAQSRIFSSPPVLLREVFLDSYLPFFDQYHQSMTFFAPDSSAFTFAGANADDEGGVYVWPLVPGATLRRIAADPTDEEPISMSTWSPT